MTRTMFATAARMALGLLVCEVLASAPAFAQGRVGGRVIDEGGQPIKGATVTAENPNASPSKYSATTDAKGNWSMIGMQHGIWVFTANAPGYAPETGKTEVKTIGSNPTVEFRLKKGGGTLAGGPNAKQLQGDLAGADTLLMGGQYDQAIEAYKAILQKNPNLSLLNMQIGEAYRRKKDYDNAFAAYQDALKGDPSNARILIAIGMAYMEKGDFASAEKTLQEAVDKQPSDREVYYNLAEVKFAGGKTDEAGTYYQKASEIDPKWAKPLFKLGLVAFNKSAQADAASNKEEAARFKAQAADYFEKTIAADPNSPEAAAAKQAIEQYGLKK